MFSCARPDLDLTRTGVDSICASCTSCGEENPERARFCHACGEPLEEESSERFRRTVTILFSDVVDSTGLGERLDPETLSYVLTDYFEGVKPVVERHGGRLAKFIGDAVMAVYGLTELHALRPYERKEVFPAAARARALLEELAPRVAEETPA